MVLVNLDTSAICRLFKEYGLPLELLGADLLNIFRQSHDDVPRLLHLEALRHDIRDMIEMLSSEIQYDEVLDSLDDLLLEVNKHLSYVSLDRLRLVNIQFMGYDTLILEYRK